MAGVRVDGRAGSAPRLLMHYRRHADQRTQHGGGNRSPPASPLTHRIPQDFSWRKANVDTRRDDIDAAP
jgi:hypothetical protein